MISARKLTPLVAGLLCTAALLFAAPVAAAEEDDQKCTPGDMQDGYTCVCTDPNDASSCNWNDPCPGTAGPKADGTCPKVKAYKDCDSMLEAECDGTLDRLVSDLP